MLTKVGPKLTKATEVNDSTTTGPVQTVNKVIRQLTISRGVERRAECGGKGRDVLLGATADPDTAVQRRGARHAHENAQRLEFFQHCAGIAAVRAAIDGHEVGGRGQGDEPEDDASEIGLRQEREAGS